MDRLRPCRDRDHRDRGSDFQDIWIENWRRVVQYVQLIESDMIDQLIDHIGV